MGGLVWDYGITPKIRGDSCLGSESRGLASLIGKLLAKHDTT